MGGVNGNELWQIPVPCTFCEPISILQRVTEVGRCENVMREASFFPDPFERIAWIASFFMTVFGSFN